MATTDSTAELQARIAALEARMDRLEPRSGSGAVIGAEADAGTAEDSEAVATSEAITTSDAAAALEESDGTPAARDGTAAARPSAADPSGAAASSPDAQPADGDGPTSPTDDPYWVLTGLQERYPDDDVVLYGGTMSAGEGGYRWQYALPTETVLDADFADAAPALTALAHPVRLALLQAVLTGTHTTADLSALPGLGTSGQVYHHLNQLASAGWLRSPRRGRWEVPGERTIPLLALIMAATS